MKKNYSDSKNMARKQHFDDIANKLLDETEDADFFMLQITNVSTESELEEISVFISNKILHR